MWQAVSSGLLEKGVVVWVVVVSRCLRGNKAYGNGKIEPEASMARWQVDGENPAPERGASANSLGGLASSRVRVLGT